MGVLSVPNDFTAGTSISSSQVNANNTAIETWSTTISDDNFSSAAGMYSTYRTILTTQGQYQAGGAAGDYLLAATSLVAETTNNGFAVGGPTFIYLDDADYTISGRTPKLRIRAQMQTNATTPAATLTIGLYPVSAVAGAASQFQATLGAVTAGSTVAFSPVGSTSNQGNSGDFAFPADGHYAIGVGLSTGVAANAMGIINVQLQQRWT